MCCHCWAFLFPGLILPQFIMTLGSQHGERGLRWCKAGWGCPCGSHIGMGDVYGYFNEVSRNKTTFEAKWCCCFWKCCWEQSSKSSRPSLSGNILPWIVCGPREDSIRLCRTESNFSLIFFLLLRLYSWKKSDWDLLLVCKLRFLCSLAAPLLNVRNLHLTLTPDKSTARRIMSWNKTFPGK